MTQHNRRRCCWPRCPKPVSDLYTEVPMCGAHAEVVHHQVEITKTPTGSIDYRHHKRSQDKPGHIYYLVIDGHIKIGYASKLQGRLTAYPPHSMLLGHHPGTMRQELELHATFAAHRSGGNEWYEQAEQIMAHIMRIQLSIEPITLKQWIAEQRAKPSAPEPLRPRPRPGHRIA
jgi:hypothetical protein